MFSIKSIYLAIVSLCVVIKFTKESCASQSISGSCGGATKYFDNTNVLTTGNCNNYFNSPILAILGTIDSCCGYCNDNSDVCNYFTYDKNTQHCNLYTFALVLGFDFGKENCFISSPNHYVGYITP